MYVIIILYFVFNRAFNRYDVNQDGFITIDDLRVAFKAQGRECSEEDLYSWVVKRSRFGSGKVSFSEFKEHYTKPVRL